MTFALGFHATSSGKEGTSRCLSALYGMKMGGGFYRDGQRIGELVYVSAFAMRDSRNPQFLTADKATQFSIIVNVSLPKTSDFSVHEWAVGESNAKRPVRIITCHYDEHRTVMVIEALPAR